jgi:ABC-type nickel/cobalt efflux system permease component RcnA
MKDQTKSLHLLQILSAGAAGEYAQIQLQMPTTDQLIHFIQVGAQVLIAVVTCWAAVRKALQETKAQAKSPDKEPVR